ncbi:MAG: Spy/CpxP family protein refolding chaperone [Cohaesibacteraceae bacterium]|nr:Spy/CpxP family protein refolding chaperone [Cohaesibacteraceae bacterium]MBL4877153.1 Spy/CpxP family protein refolding chaperone [Cohaesibacteraceae bacterium]
MTVKKTLLALSLIAGTALGGISATTFASAQETTVASAQKDGKGWHKQRRGQHRRGGGMILMNPDRIEKIAKRVSEKLDLTDVQQTSLDELVEAAKLVGEEITASREAGKANRPTTVPERLKRAESKFGNMEAVYNTLAPKLMVFYDTLDADQQKQLDKFASKKNKFGGKRGPNGKRHGKAPWNQQQGPGAEQSAPDRS